SRFSATLTFIPFDLALGDDAIDAVTIGLVRLQRQSKLLAHDAREESAHRVLLPAGRLHNRLDSRSLGVTEHLNNASLLRVCPVAVRLPLRQCGAVLSP